MQEGQEEPKPPESPIESTVCKERMLLIIQNNTQIVADSKKILDILNADPSLDGSFCRIFGVKPLPPTP